MIYSSRGASTDLFDILRVSRANNGVDGISGLFLAKNGIFVQVLEGPPESVASTFERISRDRRHSHLEVLSETEESERIFGGWAMAGLPGENQALVRDRVALLTANAPPSMKKLFESHL